MNMTEQKVEFIIDKRRIFPVADEQLFSRLLVDFETMRFMTRPSDTTQIRNIIQLHCRNAKNIIDATAGIGGDSIAFCKNFEHVVSIEIDPHRFSFLENNINVYNFKNIDLIQGDCLTIIPSLKNIDVIFIDPPWGGNGYKNKQLLKLTLSNIELESVILKFISNSDMLCVPKLIILKMPKNYDIKYLFSKIKKENNEIYLYELKKMFIIAIKIVK